MREQRKETIFNMWLACHTQEEIAEAVGVSIGEINNQIKECSDLERFPKMNKLSATFEDNYTPPIFFCPLSAPGASKGIEYHLQ